MLSSEHPVSSRKLQRDARVSRMSRWNTRLDGHLHTGLLSRCFFARTGAVVPSADWKERSEKRGHVRHRLEGGQLFFFDALPTRLLRDELERVVVLHQCLKHLHVARRKGVGPCPVQGRPASVEHVRAKVRRSSAPECRSSPCWQRRRPAARRRGRLDAPWKPRCACPTGEAGTESYRPGRAKPYASECRQ